MKNTTKIQLFSFMSLLILLMNSCTKADDKPIDIPKPTVTDIDGNVYHTVTIGTQVWMVENLKTTKYRNGDQIPYVSSASMWQSTITGAYGDYNNNTINSDTYGRLYNWYAVNDSRNIAPVGWHVPSDAEWTVLTDFLGGETIAGAKLKNNSGWLQNGNGTNESGFSALPGGYVAFGVYSGIGYDGSWWSSTETVIVGIASSRYLKFDKIDIFRYPTSEYLGLGVRCIKD